MEKIKTNIKGLFLIEHDIYSDDCGYFIESYDEEKYKRLGVVHRFVKENTTISRYGTLRGMHIQKNHPQAKLVRVVNGLIYNVVIDLRKDSETYGEWFAAYLDNIQCRSIYIPERFAHGFLTISPEATVIYKTSDLYYPNDDLAIKYDDKDLNISWHRLSEIQVIQSNKDGNAMSFNEYERYMDRDEL